MSKQEDLARGMPAPKLKGKRTNNAQFISYTPHKEDLLVLEALAERPEEINEDLEGVLRSDIVISMSRDGSTPAIKVMLYDKSEPYETRTYITFWASNPIRALTLLAHAARVGHVSTVDGIMYAKDVQLSF